MFDHARRDGVEGRRLAFTAGTWLEHLEEREARLLMDQRVPCVRGRGIQGERDTTAEAGEQGLQSFNGISLTLAFRQGRIGQAEHRSDFRLIGRQQQIGLLARDHVQAVAHIQQPFDCLVIGAVGPVGKPGCRERGHEHCVAQAAASLFDIRLVQVREPAELLKT